VPGLIVVAQESRTRAMRDDADVVVYPEPQPDPGWELDCAEMAPVGGVIATSWKTSPTGSERTTNAGELLTVPVAQLG
jgi:hypothetical protein